MPKAFPENFKQQWKENILKQRQSKLSIASWCLQNAVAVHTFYYWQSKLFPKPLIDRSAFIEAVEEDKSVGIIIEYQGVNLYIEEHFNPSVLRKCLEVLKTC